MKIKSEIKNIRVISANVLNFIRKSGKKVSKNTLFDIKLCIEEAVRNAIVHGNNSEVDMPIDVSWEIVEDTIKIVVEDRGKGFDIKALPDPTDEANLTKESGRGVYIILRLMDKVVYNDTGNCVAMEKKLV